MISSRKTEAKAINAGDFHSIFGFSVRALAFIKKDLKIAVSYRLQFLFQFVQIFFSIAIIYFVGKMLSITGQNLFVKYGCDYFSFALVGLAINSYLRAGMVTITNDVRQIMNQGTLEAICMAPLNYTSLIFLCSSWQFVFETIKVMSYFVIASLVFGMKLENININSTLVVWILTVSIFFMLGIISCSILIIVKKGDPVNWIFSSLGAILAGTMFPVDVLPSWMQVISSYFPLTHSLEAFRKAVLLGAGIYDIKNNLLVLLLFFILLVPVTLCVNRICMDTAKRKGAFSTH